MELEWDAHSELYDIINTGIELDLILNDDNLADSMERLDRVKSKVDTEQKEMKRLRQQESTKKKMTDKISEAIRPKNQSNTTFNFMGSLGKEKMRAQEMKEKIK